MYGNVKVKYFCIFRRELISLQGALYVQFAQNSGGKREKGRVSGASERMYEMLFFVVSIIESSE